METFRCSRVSDPKTEPRISAYSSLLSALPVRRIIYVTAAFVFCRFWISAKRARHFDSGCGVELIYILCSDNFVRCCAFFHPLFQSKTHVASRVGGKVAVLAEPVRARAADTVLHSRRHEQAHG